MVVESQDNVLICFSSFKCCELQQFVAGLVLYLSMIFVRVRYILCSYVLFNLISCYNFNFNMCKRCFAHQFQVRLFVIYTDFYKRFKIC